jgi:hypothetical protein
VTAKYRPGDLLTPWGHTPKTGKHLVDTVDFIHNVASARCVVTCLCSWKGTVAEWPDHAPGLRVSSGWTEAGYPRRANQWVS